jgi:hypothetical protein
MVIIYEQKKIFLKDIMNNAGHDSHDAIMTVITVTSKKPNTKNVTARKRSLLLLARYQKLYENKNRMAIDCITIHEGKRRPALTLYMKRNEYATPSPIRIQALQRSGSASARRIALIFPAEVVSFSIDMLTNRLICNTAVK